ncbi:hypothetical protein VCHA53O466_40345 [Vibrio chagasii]|nr:hypothetical protein VCHA53O466_40345 [Vibrio chagasii]
MSILKEIITQNKETYTNKDGQSGATFTLAVRVIRAEGEMLIGTRLDTKEEIKVVLGAYEKKANSEFDRPSIGSLFEGRGGVQVGGVICFERAYSGQDGIWVSRWPRVISKFPAGHAKFDTKAAVVKTKMFIGESAQGHKYIEFKSIFPSTIKPISSVEDVTRIASGSLVPTLNGVTPFLAFTIRDGEEKISFDMRPQIIETNDGLGNKNKVINPNTEESVRLFFESQYGDLLTKCIGAQLDIRCVIGSTIYAGTKTKENTLKNKAVVEFFKKEFTLNEDEAYSRSNCGYKDMILGIKEEDGFKYITHFHSIAPYETAMSENEIY